MVLVHVISRLFHKWCSKRLFTSQNILSYSHNSSYLCFSVYLRHFYNISCFRCWRIFLKLLMFWWAKVANLSLFYNFTAHLEKVRWTFSHMLVYRIHSYPNTEGLLCFNFIRHGYKPFSVSNHHQLPFEMLVLQHLWRYVWYCTLFHHSAT